MMLHLIVLVGALLRELTHMAKTKSDLQAKVSELEQAAVAAQDRIQQLVQDADLEQEVNRIDGVISRINGIAGSVTPPPVQ